MLLNLAFLEMVLSDVASTREIAIDIVGHCICGTNSLSVRPSREIIHLCWRVLHSLRSTARDERLDQI